MQHDPNIQFQSMNNIFTYLIKHNYNHEQWDQFSINQEEKNYIFRDLFPTL